PRPKPRGVPAEDGRRLWLPGELTSDDTTGVDGGVPVHVVVRGVSDDVGRECRRGKPSRIDDGCRLVDLPGAAGENELTLRESRVDHDAAVLPGDFLVDVPDVDLGASRATGDIGLEQRGGTGDGPGRVLGRVERERALAGAGRFSVRDRGDLVRGLEVGEEHEFVHWGRSRRGRGRDGRGRRWECGCGGRAGAQHQHSCGEPGKKKTHRHLLVYGRSTTAERFWMKTEQANKPDPVVDGHLSGTEVTLRL